MIHIMACYALVFYGEISEFVLVHVGFAIQIVDKRVAQESLQFIGDTNE